MLVTMSANDPLTVRVWRETGYIVLESRNGVCVTMKRGEAMELIGAILKALEEK